MNSIIHNIGFMIKFIIQFIRKDLCNLLRFYNLLRAVCLVNYIYIYIKCISN